MLESILGTKFEIFPVELKENQVHCSTCGGTKWMHQDGKWLVPCKDCYDGTQKVCSICGKVVPRMRYQCEDCRSIKEQQEEQKRIEKAEKLEPDSEKANSFEMMYSEVIGSDESAYFSDWSSFFDSYSDNLYGLDEEDTNRPEYVWGTEAKSLSLNADTVLEHALDDFYEGASDDIGDSGYNALQDALDKWVSEYGNITSYEVTYKYAIRIPWEDYKKD